MISATTSSSSRLGIALSGGGTRAIGFHLGVLQTLARRQQLEKITRISTVSGGSLLVAAIYSISGHRWPNSTQYQQETLPAIKALLTKGDLFSLPSAMRDWRRLYLLPSSRSRIVAHNLTYKWGIHGKLTDLPDSPVWQINTTCIETGKNWRFSRFEMGDWVFGRHYSPNFSIAAVAAASAAVPYALGAMRFELPTEGWFETDPATSKPRNRKAPPLRSVRLWDGGVYENLGLEPLYKPGRGLIGCDELYVSDASGHVPTIGTTRPWLGILQGNLSSPRLFDIAADQIRALRSRMFMDAVLSGNIKGKLFRLGRSIRDIEIAANIDQSTATYSSVQADGFVSELHKYPTNLGKLSSPIVDALVQHGAECSEATLHAYPDDVRTSDYSKQ